jgi:hypothetical protein
MSFLGYLPLYFWRQGLLARDPDDSWWKFHFQRQSAHQHAFYMIWCVKIMILAIAVNDMKINF